MAEIGMFYNNMHKLLSTLTTSSSYNTTSTSTYINGNIVKYMLQLTTTAHYLSNINLYTITTNILSISTQIQYNTIYMVLCNCIIIVFVCIVIVQLWRVIRRSKEYGGELLAILPAPVMCQSIIGSRSKNNKRMAKNMMEYQVNCVYYRTGFAKNTTQL